MSTFYEILEPSDSAYAQWCDTQVTKGELIMSRAHYNQATEARNRLVASIYGKQGPSKTKSSAQSAGTTITLEDSNNAETPASTSTAAEEALQTRRLLAAATYIPINSSPYTSYSSYLQSRPHQFLSYSQWSSALSTVSSFKHNTLSKIPKYTTLQNSWVGDDPYCRPEKGEWVAYVANCEDSHYIAVIGECSYDSEDPELDIPDGVIRGCDVHSGRKGYWFDIGGNWVFEFDRDKDGDDVEEGRIRVETKDRLEDRATWTYLRSVYRYDGAVG